MFIFLDRSIWSKRTFVSIEVSFLEFGTIKKKYTRYTVHESAN